MMKYLYIFFILLSTQATAQKLKKAEKKIVENLKTEITYLSSDALQGRRAGSEGEKLAYQYLSDQFKAIGLIPKGDNNSYLQAFTINEGKEILPATHFIINDTSLKSGKDFFPLIVSGNGKAGGDVSPAFKEKGMPWFWDIKETLAQNEDNPHFDIVESAKQQALNIQKKGASALIVFNSDNEDDDLHFDAKSKMEAVNIPVVYLSKKMAAKYLSDNAANLNVDLEVAIGEKTSTAHNVIGYIDNGAPYTIILGAHYDHLGFGDDHNATDPGVHEIHNGADDNASGTAAVLELAKMVKDSKLNKNNFLFVCFSGEELGLLGSKYFTEHPGISLDAVNYMINMDMIGRLDDATKTLIIGGYGTSPEWSKILPEKTKSLNVKFDSTGIGPSDHTSFYLKNIPVLFFFTGMQKDYHKATDDADKINYTGELRIIQYIEDLLKKTNND
ncbi:MAG TPA: M20/M25/M40 family metallo-hydrolase, partial [Hanamia sp.]|nr:M20/M25/M40 family metallo-hydrolase [Hanamia sp.]